MTRINVVPVEWLTDSHLMAEYRELPMVMASAKRSDPKRYKITTNYTLNTGHVTFFWCRKKYLLDRWLDLIAELNRRGYNLNPSSRVVHWRELDRWPQVDWTPSDEDVEINAERLRVRIYDKPEWYRYYGKRLTELESCPVDNLWTAR